MADSQFNARLRADAGAPTSGVIHVRTRLTADFTVLSNALAQRRGSAVTVGVAAYISSLPNGSPVSISALCEHFSEGEILISRALRELEATGYLERRRERLPTGQIRTRTYFYAVPGAHPDGDPPEPPRPPRPRRRAAAEPAPEAAPAHAADPAPVPGDRDEPHEQAEVPTEQADAPTPLAELDPRAVAVLASLRLVDRRLVLTAPEAARLAPAVVRWLNAGVEASQVTEVLTTGLPLRFTGRPTGLLAFRLKEAPLPAPSPLPVSGLADPAVLPWQTCDGCERVFRAPEPGECRDCRDCRGDSDRRNHEDHEDHDGLAAAG